MPVAEGVRHHVVRIVEGADTQAPVVTEDGVRAAAAAAPPPL